MQVSEREDGTLDWTPIGQTSNQLILYHPPSHALSVQPHLPPIAGGANAVAGPSRIKPHRPFLLSYKSGASTTPSTQLCPTCSQPLPLGFTDTDRGDGLSGAGEGDVGQGYFQILERAHEGSRPPSPGPSFTRLRSATPSNPGTPPSSSTQAEVADEDEDEEAAGEAIPAKGYYERYFREEGKLGMGAEGSVYLATHIIGGSVLGTYAVKKIAVGDSESYLVKMLREVRLLETLRHPNIIPYHHAWIDRTRFSSFGPPITALHVLMMFATAGNLDTYLLTRSNSVQPSRPDLSAGQIADADSLGQLPKAERIKAFKKRRMSSIAGNRKREETRAVLLLGLEEVGKLFGDVVEGLAFLHANSILHLDLKCSNVLLHWEEGSLIPKALLSDFGTSEEMLKGSRVRTGHTGTMEYMAPETLVLDATGHWRPSDSHADMWSMGLILHKLLFLQLPYGDTEDFDVLHKAIVDYAGFVPTPELLASCERRHIPRELLLLLAKLVNVHPEARPSAEKVKAQLRGLDHILNSQRSQAQARTSTSRSSFAGSLVARASRVGSGLSNLVRATSEPPAEGTDMAESLQNSEYQPYHSPVRPILALPSPELEPGPRGRSTIAEELPTPPNMNPVLRAVTGFIARYDSIKVPPHIRFLLILLKVLSILPQVSGIKINPSLTTAAVLPMVLSLTGQLSALQEAVLLFVHISLLCGAEWGPSRGREPRGRVEL